MLLLDYIKQNGIDKLKDELSIIVKEYDNGFMVFNYSNDSPKTNPIVMECRGIILDKELNILCRPFKRFFNYGEYNTNETFSFDNVTITEKMDGSLIKVYYNTLDNKWEIGTRSTAFGENFIKYKDEFHNFRELVLKSLNLLEIGFQEMMNLCDKNNTYLFELCSPINRIVTQYYDVFMVLLAIINNQSGKDVSYNDYSEYANYICVMSNTTFPKEYSCNNIDDLTNIVEKMDDLREGVVVYDNNTGNRIKLKNALDEFLTYFPEYKPYFENIIEIMNRINIEMSNMYSLHKNIESQKDFANSIKHLLYTPLLFIDRSKNCNPDINLAKIELKLKLINNAIGDD